MKEASIKYGIPLAIGGLGVWGGLMVAKKVNKNKIIIGMIGLAVGLTIGYFVSEKITTQK
jgi:hypothetical protein